LPIERGIKINPGKFGRTDSDYLFFFEQNVRILVILCYYNTGDEEKYKLRRSIMITPQYTYDNTGNKVGVFLAIEDWNELTQIPGVDKLTPTDALVPEWQIEKGKTELKIIAEGNTELLEWSEAKKQFNL